MLKKIKYNLIGLALLIILGVTGCKKDDVTEPISPDGYPMVTYVVDVDDQIREGEILTYTITTDKMLDRALTFSAKFLDGTVDENDYVITPGVIQPFTNETKVTIEFLNDGMIEVPETMKFEIGIFGIADKNLINPKNVNPVKEVTINPPTSLDISFSWNSADDIDFVIFKDSDAALLATPFSSKGATTANPEISSIDLSATGTYFVNVIHWGMPSFDYTFKFGRSNATIDSITGTFTSDNLGAYYIDLWTGWPGYCFSSYRMLKIVNDGTSFVVTEIPVASIADPAALDGIWGGTDGALPDYSYSTNSVFINIPDDGFAHIDSLNIGWMQTFWDEPVIDTDSVKMILYSNGEVVIPKAYNFSTTYDGDTTARNIYGKGTFDGTNLHIEYEIDQGAALLGAWTFANGYNENPFFHADLIHGKQTVKAIKREHNYFVKPETNNDIKPLSSFK